MLARKQKLDAADFEAAFVIPRRPAEIQDADDRWRRALAELESRKARHVEARRLLAAQVPGEVPTISFAEVDEAGKQIEPAKQAEAVAAAARDKARGDYERQVTEKLAGALEQYREAISEKLAELEALFAVGTSLHAASIAARVPLPSKLPGAANDLNKLAVLQCRQFINRTR